ncbi:MAG: hypothetical protein C4617_05350 [Candidatus Liberibacter europaeus]|uniref:Uncharacterized protein n=1 Tax=Candidatus Liberibacter europaeus TaxID=744859 RepID=A0A2T4VWI9_9HYPH|nr:hypothetical protein [Candidatus Liberibacter europaeus]PTL86110.1 MAG: hypothetical protein C4617_05350 [Candidatus Liberibacter europaeus]
MKLRKCQVPLLLIISTELASCNMAPPSHNTTNTLNQDHNKNIIRQTRSVVNEPHLENPKLPTNNPGNTNNHSQSPEMTNTDDDSTMNQCNEKLKKLEYNVKEAGTNFLETGETILDIATRGEDLINKFQQLTNL